MMTWRVACVSTSLTPAHFGANDELSKILRNERLLAVLLLVCCLGCIGCVLLVV